MMQCRPVVRSKHYSYIEETPRDLQNLIDTCAVLCSAGAGASDNIDGWRQQVVLGVVTGA